MEIIANILIVLVAIEHLYILYVEMFAWETMGKKSFAGVIPDDLFSQTKVMAANQGLYNGFLAAGLIWSFFISNSEWNKNVSMFFLCCIIVAGTYGTLTASGKIFFIQALPAIIALLFVLFKK
jgi:putative membrane protein